LKSKAKKKEKKTTTTTTTTTTPTTTTAVTRRTIVHSLTKEVPRKSHKSSATGGVFDTYWSFNRPTPHHLRQLRIADEHFPLFATTHILIKLPSSGNSNSKRQQQNRDSKTQQ